MSTTPLTPSQEAGFRRTQRLAYECAETIAADMQPGDTERQVARRMEEWLLDHGVDDWFHRPFAWFGERTAFSGFIGMRHLGGFNPAFYPQNKKIEEGMAFILDCAPSMGGYTADIGFTGSLGENAAVEKLSDDLLEYRQLILQQVKERRPLAEISHAVDALCEKHGYEPRHKAYPFETLAHRVEVLENDGREKHNTAFYFGIRNIAELVKDKFKGGREGWSPIWNGKSSSNHVPTPGLWAVEPHLGFRGVGAKWEELLVVTESDAYWLDDDVPHVRRWQQRGLWPTNLEIEVAA